MAGTSYYPPGAFPPAASARWAADDAPWPSGPVFVAVATPAAQNRPSAAFRLVLAVPHLLVLCVLGIAASAVAVLGWLGALVTGRLPGFAFSYLSGYTRWYCRVGAYLLLLTGAYPPFSFGEAAYPVRMEASAGRLNRLAVAFRLVLAIPAAIVSAILASGVTTVVIFTAWLTVLVAGQLPGSLHQAFAAVLRYAVRYYGYLYLLTDAYPARLFGDQPGPRPGAQAPPAGVGHGTGYSGDPALSAVDESASWQLVLSPGARRLVGLILALGLLTVAGGGISAGVVLNSIRQRDMEISQLNAAIARHNSAVGQEQLDAAQVKSAVTTVTAAHEKLDSQLNTVVDGTNSCTTVSCFDTAAVSAAKITGAFGRGVRAVPFPAAAASAAKKLVAETTADKRTWMDMSRAVSFTDYEDRATRAEKAGQRFDSDYSALLKSLNQRTTALNQQAAALDEQASALVRRGAALNVPVRVLTTQAPSSPSVT